MPRVTQPLVALAESKPGCVWLHRTAPRCLRLLPRPEGAPRISRMCLRLSLQTDVLYLVLWSCGHPSQWLSMNQYVLGMEAHFSGVGDSPISQLPPPLDLSLILPPPWEAELALGCRRFHLYLRRALYTMKWQMGGENLTYSPCPGSPRCLGSRAFAGVGEHASMRWSN